MTEIGWSCSVAFAGAGRSRCSGAARHLSLQFPNRGGTYDFAPIDEAIPGFLARGPAPYEYRPPPALRRRVGAAIHSGAKLSLSTPIYDLIYRGPHADLDPRKKAMTVEHLLTMSSGFDCDDWAGSRPPNFILPAVSR